MEESRPDEEGAPLLTMDAAIRELCERIRHRLDRLKGEHPPFGLKSPPRRPAPRETRALTPAAPPIHRAGRTWNGRDAELDAELSSVEYDINGAEFLLKEIRAKLATSSTRNLPPVAAYRASLESSRRMLDAIRLGAGIAGEPRAHGGARGARPGGSRGSMRGPPSSSGRGAGPLGRLWKGTVSFVKDLLEDPFLDPLLPPALLAAEAEKRRRGEVPETDTARDTAAAGERSMEYHVAAGPAVYSKQLTNHERIHTLEGQSVEITLLEGDVFVDRSRVVKADNAASNGYAPSPLL